MHVHFAYQTLRVSEPKCRHFGNNVFVFRKRSVIELFLAVFCHAFKAFVCRFIVRNIYLWRGAVVYPKKKNAAG